jgi:hypothetical protein
MQDEALLAPAYLQALCRYRVAEKLTVDGKTYVEEPLVVPVRTGPRDAAFFIEAPCGKRGCAKLFQRRIAAGHDACHLVRARRNTAPYQTIGGPP